ncbi:hypothetical protein CEXT_194921 [Caerostris extrusa]|uniref:Uncharacterized protein n=1 Tax=Caerostris extrusa TaxID=172846 RepID=A0AAV4M842_CAEEX|nr:hypothetical protein CEXT_194921 [Caerostris extrusa]
MRQRYVVTDRLRREKERKFLIFDGSVETGPGVGGNANGGRSHTLPRFRDGVSLFGNGLCISFALESCFQESEIKEFFLRKGRGRLEVGGQQTKRAKMDGETARTTGGGGEGSPGRLTSGDMRLMDDSPPVYDM